jgi:hypothetical protein
MSEVLRIDAFCGKSIANIVSFGLLAQIASNPNPIQPFSIHPANNERLYFVFESNYSMPAFLKK